MDRNWLKTILSNWEEQWKKQWATTTEIRVDPELLTVTAVTSKLCTHFQKHTFEGWLHQSIVSYKRKGENKSSCENLWSRVHPYGESLEAQESFKGHQENGTYNCCARGKFIVEYLQGQFNLHARMTKDQCGCTVSLCHPPVVVKVEYRPLTDHLQMLQTRHQHTTHKYP